MPKSKPSTTLVKCFCSQGEVSETNNYSTICRLFFKQCMFLLWPEGVRYDDVLLFVTDAVPYIVKGGKVVQAFYPKMVHIICLAHSLHRVAEEIRANFCQDSLLQTALQVHGFRCPTPTRTCHHEMGHMDRCSNLLL